MRNVSDVFTSPERLLVTFPSDEIIFNNTLDLDLTLLDKTGGDSDVESHNFLGSWKHYHELLCQVFKKIQDEHQKMKREPVLRFRIKACNNALGYERLVPSYLESACMPRFLSVYSFISMQHERMVAMEEARKEMATILEQFRIKRGILSEGP